MSLPTFISEENTARAAQYAKPKELEDKIIAINNQLKGLENYQTQKDTNDPTLFIFGLPRSGTTLTSQIISAGLDIGYINNLIARFWLAPTQGITLSKALLGENKDTSFLSDFGKSVNIQGPHEFAYFWQKHLHIESTKAACQYGQKADHINWNELSKIIESMKSTFGKGIAFKTNYVANFIESFSQHTNQPIFIYIERDLLSSALSILNARKQYYNNIDTWWATYPPNYEEIVNLPFDQQIAHQVISLSQTYQQQLQKVHQDQVIKINYQELCQAPKAFLESIANKVNKSYQSEIKLNLNNIPDTFKISPPKQATTPEEKQLEQTLNKLISS